MITVAITNADTLLGGTLIRLLLNHPDVEIAAAVAPLRAGRPLSAVHPGLTGDTTLTFSAGGEGVKADAVFLVGNAACDVPVDATTRIIDTTGTYTESADYIQGIPELTRKLMVRGGRHVAMPPAATVPLILALLPLAKNLLLRGKISVDIEADVFSDREKAEVMRALGSVQSNLDDIELHIHRRDMQSPRVMRCTVTLPCSLDSRHLNGLIDECYDDHNFVFRTDSAADADEVINTNKCLLSAGTDGTTATITAIIDPEIKGAAGNAIHALNLLFGLHERIGLQLTPLGPTRP